MIVLDTTVFVYAKGADHPLRDPCRELIAAIADERIEATTTAEVIGEFVHVRARRRGRGDAAALGRALRRAAVAVDQPRPRSTPAPRRCCLPMRRSPNCPASRTSSPTRPGLPVSSRSRDGPPADCSAGGDPQRPASLRRGSPLNSLAQ